MDVSLEIEEIRGIAEDYVNRLSFKRRWIFWKRIDQDAQFEQLGKETGFSKEHTRYLFKETVKGLQFYFISNYPEYMESTMNAIDREKWPSFIADVAKSNIIPPQGWKWTSHRLELLEEYIRTRNTKNLDNLCGKEQIVMKCRIIDFIEDLDLKLKHTLR